MAAKRDQAARMPAVRGALTEKEPLATFIWFRLVTRIGAERSVSW